MLLKLFSDCEVYLVIDMVWSYIVTGGHYSYDSNDFVVDDKNFDTSTPNEWRNYWIELMTIYYRGSERIIEWEIDSSITVYYDLLK